MNRRLLFLALAVVALGGCTNHQLRRSTIGQAGTLTELQYQQVLNNLAMFANNPSAIPAQIALSDGSAQVTDGATGGVFASLGDTSGGGVSRTVVEQWSMRPITDDTSLQLLQMAYLNALTGATRTLANDPDFATDLAHELKQQIAVTDDLRKSTELFYDRYRSDLITDLLSGGANRAKKQKNLNAFNVLRNAFTSENLDQLGVEKSQRYLSFDRGTVTADDPCFDCVLDKSRITIKNHTINGWQAAEAHAGDTLEWRNEDDRDYYICSSSGETLQISRPKEGEEVRETTSRAPDAAQTVHYWLFDVDGTTNHKDAKKSSPPTGPTFDLIVKQDDCADGDSDGPNIWYVQVKDDGFYVGARPPKEGGERTPSSKWQGGIRLKDGDAVQINAGDFIRWVNHTSSGKLTIDSGDGAPTSIGLQDLEKNHLESIPFPRTNASQGQPDGFRYLLNLSNVPACEVELLVKVNERKLSSPLTKEVCRRIKDVNDSLKKIPSGWFGIGAKRDVPHDACYVGHYAHTYTWVRPAGRQALSDFTLTVLKFTDLLKEQQVITIPGGVRYSPGTAGAGRFFGL